jgi:transposase-like protein
MARYSEERKSAILKKLLPPQNRTVVSVATEEGISDATLYNWLKQCRKQGDPVPGRSKTSEEWSGEAKLAVVIETAALSEEELSVYCREKGLYVEQVKRWKEACVQGTGQETEQRKETQKQKKQSQKRIKTLEAEIRRKDKVLAETTSLLVLSKKLEALYGTDQDNEDS